MKKAKLILSIVLVLTMVAAFMSGCGSSSQPEAAQAPSTSTSSGTASSAPASTPSEPAPAPAKPVKVCVVMSGMLGDMAYNDKLKEGTDRAEAELGVTVKLIEAASSADFESNLISACDGDYDFIICQGSGFLNLLATHAPNYPDKKFAITDAIMAQPSPENVLSIAFAPNEGQFLAGAAMAMLTTRTDFPGINEEKIVGWISGTESPNLNDFWAGFEQGVHYIDPDITILKAFAGSFGDPIKGKELALAQYEQGADIIAQVANRTGLGIIEAAEESKLYCIGVDSIQDGLAPGYILTSMYKNIDEGVYAGIKSVVDGTFEGGGFIYMDLAAGGVGLSDFSVFREFWGDQFPEDIVEECSKLEEMIKSGEIKVNTYPGIRPWENN